MEEINLYVYYAFANEPGCSGGDGRGRLFFTKSILSNEMIDKIYDNSDGIYLEYCGVLNKEMKLRYSICSNSSYSCCSGYTRYNNFIFENVVQIQDNENINLSRGNGIVEESKVTFNNNIQQIPNNKNIISRKKNEFVEEDEITFNDAIQQIITIDELEQLSNWS